MWVGVLGPLLAHPNQVVSFDALADAIWETGPASNSRVTIRNDVRRLRQIRGDSLGNRIVTRDPGYLVEIGDDECDLLAFSRTYRRGMAGRGGPHLAGGHGHAGQRTAALAR